MCVFRISSRAALRPDSRDGDGVLGRAHHGATHNVGRNVWEGSIPPRSSDFEYYIVADCGHDSPNETLFFPPGAPTVRQTVVLF